MTEIDHRQVLDTAVEHLGPVLEASPDGVYIWVDETHKTCNERLAAMFGRTVEDWCAVDDFLGSFVAKQDRELYGYNYHTHVRGLLYPVTFRFQGLHKDGTTFAAETDMVPVAFHGHPVAFHFVRKLAP